MIPAVSSATGTVSTNSFQYISRSYQAETNTASTSTIHVSEAGKLATLLTEASAENLKSIKITGSVNSSDIYSLREYKNLEEIDMSEAISTDGGTSWYTFECNTTIRRFSFPKGIKYIEGCFFRDCFSLQEVRLPENLLRIGSSAFSGCTALQEISLPESLITIEGGAFHNCSTLKTIRIPENITELSNDVFSSCTGLTSVVFPEKLQTIGNSTFYGCSQLVEIKLPTSLTTIGSSAFHYCSQLAEVKLPTSLTTIGNSAFYGCNRMSEIQFPANLTTIESSAFQDCSIDFQTEIPASVKSIGEQIFGTNRYLKLNATSAPLFTGSTAYEYLAVPAGAKKAYQESGRYANSTIIEGSGKEVTLSITEPGSVGEKLLDIAGVEYLRDVNRLILKGSINQKDLNLISKSMSGLFSLDLSETDVETFESAQFKGSKLMAIRLPKTLTEISSEAFQDCHYLQSIDLPKKVIRIKDYAFSGCSAIRNITLNKELQHIGYQAFWYCYKLQSVTFNEKLQSIDNYAFGSCGQLQEITLPNMLQSIGYAAFQSCPIKTISIPSTVTGIGENAFNCASLKTIECNAAVPVELNRDPFSGIDRSKAELIVPKWAIKAYKLADYWGSFWTITAMAKEKVDYLPVNGKLTLEAATAPGGTPIIDLFRGSELKVEAGVNLQASTLRLYNSYNGYNGHYASFINSSADFSANRVEMSAEFSGNQWHFVTFPFDLAQSEITDSNNTPYVIRYYDGEQRAQEGSGASWKNVGLNETLTAGRGYIIQASETIGNLMFSPSEANGKRFFDRSASLTLNAHASSNAANRNWNFIGNPFACYYDISRLEFGAPITVWDAVNNTYKALSPKDDSYYLAPYQAFFVQKPDGTDRIVFVEEGKKTYSATQQLRQNSNAYRFEDTDRKIINLTLQNGALSDDCRIVLNQEAATAYELNCDAAKFMSATPGVAQLYSLDGNGTRYAINERPEIGDDIPLGISIAQTGHYTIDATTTAEGVLLMDKMTNAITDLTTGAYSFEAVQGVDESRFSLRINKAATGIEEVTHKTCVYSKGATIIIHATEGSQVQIVNAAGITTTRFKATTETHSIEAAPGVYVITVGNESFRCVIY